MRDYIREPGGGWGSENYGRRADERRGEVVSLRPALSPREVGRAHNSTVDQINGGGSGDSGDYEVRRSAVSSRARLRAARCSARRARPAVFCLRFSWRADRLKSLRMARRSDEGEEVRGVRGIGVSGG